jgi:hypothetical protein
MHTGENVAETLSIPNAFPGTQTRINHGLSQGRSL